MAPFALLLSHSARRWDHPHARTPSGRVRCSTAGRACGTTPTRLDCSRRVPRPAPAHPAGGARRPGVLGECETMMGPGAGDVPRRTYGETYRFPGQTGQTGHLSGSRVRLAARRPARPRAPAPDARPRPERPHRGRTAHARGLARRLSEYGVKSKTVRIGSATPKGYAREDLWDAWSSYLPSPPQERATSATSATRPADNAPNGADGADVADVAEFWDADPDDRGIRWALCDAPLADGLKYLCADCRVPEAGE